MFLSVFELFKIGIGPSSSHTVGPMVAANRFLNEILNGDWPRPASDGVARISVSLHGSLAFTGKGHASDRAIILGLAGKSPSKVTRQEADAAIVSVLRQKTVSPAEHPEYRFSPETDLVFDYDTILPGHSNGMTFFAYSADGRMLLKRIYYSVGGGFILSEDELTPAPTEAVAEVEAESSESKGRNTRRPRKQAEASNAQPVVQSSSESAEDKPKKKGGWWSRAGGFFN